MVFFRSLSVRLKLLTALWLVVALGAISFTLLLSWRMQGAGAAINDMGSLRMQSYRLGLAINGRAPESVVSQHIEHFEQTLNNLQHGDPLRPLFLPNNPEIREGMQQLLREWHTNIKPHFQAAFQRQTRIDRDAIEQFINQIDHLTYYIEQAQSNHLNLLRLFQMSLLVLVLISAAVVTYWLNSWVLEPLKDLQMGVHNVHQGQFGVQVPVNNVSEFAELDNGFNQMSTHLRHLYGNLEQQVAQKTHDLAQQTQTLATLYDFSKLLNQANHAAEACDDFLAELMKRIHAQAASIRLIDFKRQKLDLIAQMGLPESLQTAEACQKLDDCLCGKAVQNNSWQPIHFHQQKSATWINEANCRQLGFHYLRVFQIRYNGQDLGVLTLYFQQEQTLGAWEEVINSLCHQLGSTVINFRLADESRQLAVLQERNLMAQGLHDSIAQTLNFLNLQTQMLESSLKAKNEAEVAESLQFIKDGVKECYDDVRELLLNFRTKITRKEFAEAVDTLAQRFRQQTHSHVSVTWGGDGVPLSSEQQLQFLFILQESLSNIRKHAQAHDVKISFENHDDFVMSIQDNGRGFDLNTLDLLSGSHVGLGIMRERAGRINAQFDLQSAPHHGTQVRLILPKNERILE